MFNDRTETIQIIRELEIPVVPLAELAQTTSPRISEFVKGRGMNREVELRVIRAVAQVKKVWQGYQIKLPIVPLDAFQRALHNLEFQERLDGAEDLYARKAALEAEIKRRELAHAAEPIRSAVSTTNRANGVLDAVGSNQCSAHSVRYPPSA